MVGIWLDNKKNPPFPNPYTNAGGIAGNVTYISGYGILAAYSTFTVINSGGITSPTFGIGLRSGGAVTNQAGGNISATQNGVNVQGGGSVTNATGGTIGGGSRGVLILGGTGAIVNQATASIIGAFEGADLEASGVVYNAGTITGNYGIVARSGSTVSITTSGRVSGASDGVFVGQVSYLPPILGGATNGTVFNQGQVTASGSGGLANGIVMNVAIGYIKNTGTVTGKDASGKQGLGIAMNYGGGLFNTGTVAGGLAGFSAGGNPAHKGPANIVNQGQIFGSTYGVRLKAGGSVQNTGTISGTGYGGLGAPKVDGTGITLANGGTVTNSGLVYGTQFGVEGAKGGTVTNSGKIIATTTTTARGIEFFNGGKVTNNTGGTISGFAYGIIDRRTSYQNSATVLNAGTIQSMSTGAKSGGIVFETLEGTVTNRTGGVISGDTGVWLNIESTLVNYGTVTGVGSYHPTGFRTTGGGLLSNAAGATISGSENGASLVSSAYTPMTVFNDGVIKGTGTNGVGLRIDGPVDMTNDTTGYISGTSYGVVSSKYVATFTSHGTIEGGQFAVKLPGGKANQLRISPSASFSGTIDLGKASGTLVATTTLVLLASETAKGLIGGLGTSVINVGTVSFDPGAQWTVEGASTAIAGGQTLNGFAAGDVIDIAGVTGEHITGFLNDTLTLNGSTKLNVIIPGAFNAASFKVSDDGFGGTKIESTAKPPKQIGWSGGHNDNDLGFAANWTDFTNSPTGAAGSVPAATDNAWFVAGGGRIIGTATVASLLFGGSTGWAAGASTGLTVTGAGGVTVGQGGTGDLTLEGGGKIASQGVMDIISGGGTGHAFVTVTGAGSDWTSSGALLVGGSGLSRMSIMGGGHASAGAGLVVANAPEAAGSAVGVAGGGSRLTVTGRLDVAAAGSGAFSLSGGATATADTLEVADVAAANGEIALTGPGTALTIAGSATVADDGTAVLSVLSGATFAAASLTIGARENSSGTAIVSGAGSVIGLTGALNVGTALGVGDLVIGPGGAVHASVVNLQGQVVLESGVLDPTVTVINQGQTVSGNGAVQAGNIIDEGVIEAGGSNPSQRSLIVQGTVMGGGTLTIDGTVRPSNAVGELRINAGATMELTGPVLNAATTTFADDMAQPGAYTVNNSVVDVTFADGSGVLLLDDIAGFGGTITSFQHGDQFVIAGGTLSNLGVSNLDTLTFSDGGAIDRIIFDAPISASGFNIVNGNTVQVACFAAGTRIETETGPVAVERLAVGDRLVTIDGECEPIVWIGQRAVNCARHPRPGTVWPVRVRPRAFGETVPARDLFLSPDHAVFIDDVLVPVRLLCNGTGITQVERTSIVYYHVELSRHAVIFAEGLPVESYLDTGDRSEFNPSGDGAALDGGRIIRLFPMFGVRDTDVAARWERSGVAPLVVTGPALEAVKQRLRLPSATPAGIPRAS